MPYDTGKTRQFFLIGAFILFIASCNKDSDIISQAYLNNDNTSETKENNNSSGDSQSEEEDSDTEQENEQLTDSTEVIYELRTAALAPSDDAYLQDGIGYNQSVIRLYQTVSISFLMFDLSAIDSIGGTLKSGTLKLTVDANAGDGKIEVYKGNSSNWTELDITADSAPGADGLLGSIEKNYAPGTTEEIELDVSSLLPGKTTFVLIHYDGDDLAFASKESSSGSSPQLSLGYEVPEGAPALPATGENQEEAQGSDSTPQEETTDTTNIAPVAKINASPLSGTAPLTVSFSSEGSTDDVGISSYSWDFKDGGSSTATNPQHTFEEAGTYAVTLAVKDSNGLAGTATVDITVSEPLPENEAPVAVASADVLVGDAPLEVSFNSSNSSDDKEITGYYWDFGTDDPSSAINPSRTFTNPGVYEVTLTVKDAEGLTDADTITITVNTSPDGGTGGGTGTYPPGSVLASSFGYNATNATNALNEAINSSNQTIVIDKQSNDWIIEPSKFFNLRDKTIIVESGVVIRAKSGAFPSTSDRLIEFIDASNVNIEGYGATLAMNKNEYTSGEGRHALSIRGCRNLTIKGLTITDSGGDGVYLSGSSSLDYSENITIEDLASLNNRRQGMTITSAENVWVRNSEFSNTNGTQPEAGLDLEPNNPGERLVNINFSGCRFYNNHFAGVKIAVAQLMGSSIPISINISDSDLGYNAQSTTHSKPRTEVFLAADHTNPVKGEVVFDGVRFNGSQVGVLFSKKTAKAYTAIFKNCTARNMIQSLSVPIIMLEAAGTSNSLGGYVFDNFNMQYERNVPFLRINAPSSVILENITGNFTIQAPYTGGVDYNNGVDPSIGVNIDLTYTFIN